MYILPYPVRRRYHTSATRETPPRPHGRGPQAATSWDMYAAHASAHAAAAASASHSFSFSFSTSTTGTNTPCTNTADRATPRAVPEAPPRGAPRLLIEPPGALRPNNGVPVRSSAPRRPRRVDEVALNAREHPHRRVAPSGVLGGDVRRAGRDRHLAHERVRGRLNADPLIRAPQGTERLTQPRRRRRRRRSRRHGPCLNAAAEHVQRRGGLEATLAHQRRVGVWPGVWPGRSRRRLARVGAARVRRRLLVVLGRLGAEEAVRRRRRCGGIR